jgi:hypothetical protein
MDDVDWSGCANVKRRVAPLTAETFVERLQLLSARVQDLRTLRSAMKKSQEEK